MRKQLLLSALISMPFAGFSQISLDASMAPPVNSMFIFYDANVPSPPFTYATSGTNNTWDFSNLTPVAGEDDTTYVVSPSSVPQASAFPNATHCTYDDGAGADLNVSEINNSAQTFLGIITNPFGTYLPLAANPPIAMMNFPLTYPSNVTGATYVELYGSGIDFNQPSVDSAHSKVNLEVEADVIASGDIVLPSGTYPALLRRERRTEYDTVWVKGAVTGGNWVVASTDVVVDSAFYWYSNQSLIPYAHALYDDTGLHDVHYFKQLVTGINSHTLNNQIEVYPNPVTEVLKIKGIVSGLTYDVAIYNTTGQMVSKGIMNAGQVNVSMLKEGSYTICLTDNRGNTFSKNFIKN